MLLFFPLRTTSFAGEKAAAVDEGFPARPIRIIVPYAKGGGLDVASRVVAKYASPHLGQIIEIDNITRGGNVHGYIEAIDAAPDGYTMAAWTNGLVTDALLIKNVPYTYSDVRPLCMFASDPHIIAVDRRFAEEAGINVLEDLFDYTKLHPGVVSIGMGGNWTTHDLMRMKIERIAKVKFNRIPFLGGALALKAVADGNCNVATPFVSELVGLNESARERILPLAVAYHERIQQFPDVASVPELGYPGMTQSIWRIFALPKDTPDQIIAILENAFRKAIESPDFLDEARALGVNPFFVGSEKLDNFLEKEYKFYLNKSRFWENRANTETPAKGNEEE